MNSPRDSDDTLDFLYGRIDYERTPPPSKREFKLQSMRSLMRRLGDPQDGLRIVHVAGTKGKGSTAAMTAAILRAAGLRTALYTSPHLESITERVAVDGAPCPLDDFRRLAARVRGPVEELDREAEAAGIAAGGPTFFDIVTAIAFLRFAESQCDAVVLEVGLGGRLDSTNVCRPDVSVITTISFDHTQQLGNTLALIAGEKAGIIKPGVPTVSGVLPDEPREVIARVARERQSPLFELGRHFHFQRLDQAANRIAYWETPSAAGVGTPSTNVTDSANAANAAHALTLGSLEATVKLRGDHQALNAAVAIAAIHRLREAGWRIGDDAIQTGLASVVCPARIEQVADHPIVILDAAHNVASIEALIETLNQDHADRPRVAVFAVNRDKDVPGILRRLLAAFPHIILTQFHNNPRVLPVDELASLARELTRSLGTATPRIEIARDTAAALQTARAATPVDGLICVTGSFFLAAEARRLLDRDSEAQPNRRHRP
ncbi:MAG: bifunctional folylpolyglutamate synthase/dihydrofolate synthase [Planctomycetota bacterium]